MSDALMGFDAEEEAFRGLGDPFLEGFGLGRAAEGVVDLNRVEAGGVMVQEEPLGRLLGVESRLPSRVGETGGPGVELRAQRLPPSCSSVMSQGCGAVGS